ncbi:uncharacterized protein LOC113283543 [Papaver somniferum]|uniref:uncharacterized protein LOC113283543 n=1 Tax=Papaver somniferum TaxID=3469 RepID=UPI000E6F96DA|nr:uncharacterized protein LOC113283543 [Papaver somniferum]XP_026388629.1 uncharacterized protein LOC113283543 [Papaver somniferum]XP_026388630.1 uncharacterized protein LOC113283543 [Papaver somniferum]XP_026388631.1 uncharacterized protein LOC113283543 [Papaver somniferum]
MAEEYSISRNQEIIDQVAESTGEIRTTTVLNTTAAETDNSYIDKKFKTARIFHSYIHNKGYKTQTAARKLEIVNSLESLMVDWTTERKNEFKLLFLEDSSDEEKSLLSSSDDDDFNFQAPAMLSNKDQVAESIGEPRTTTALNTTAAETDKSRNQEHTFKTARIFQSFIDKGPATRVPYEPQETMRSTSTRAPRKAPWAGVTSLKKF